MAIEKEYIDDRWVITNYHKICVASVRDNNLTFDLWSFPNIDYRKTARAATITSHHFEITIEEEESMGIRQLCYTKLKTDPSWADAEDC